MKKNAEKQQSERLKCRAAIIVVSYRFGQKAQWKTPGNDLEHLNKVKFCCHLIFNKYC